jgi:integrase
LAEYWLKRDNIRNYALIVLGVYTSLRPVDLLRMTWSDVYDEEHKAFRSHITLIEKKTGKLRTIALNAKATNALRMLFAFRYGSFIFSNNRKGRDSAISRVHAWRIVQEATESIGVADRIALYSLRKTAGYHAWKSGASPVVLMDIYNHSSYEVTRRYLGVSQDDRDKVYMNLAFF